MLQIRILVLTAGLLNLVAYADPPRTIPSINSQTVTGQPYHLDAKSVKRPTLIVFWATWCEACKHEIPLIMDFQKANGHEIDVIGVNIDDDFDFAKGFVKRYGLNYENVKDESGEIADAFGIVYTPTLLVIDKKGQILKEANRLQDLKGTLMSLVPQMKQSQKEAVTRDATVMGTEFSIVISTDEKEKANRAIDAALAEIRRIEDLMTDWRESELMDINHAAGKKPVKVKDELLALLDESKNASIATNGVFDVTYAPLGMLWDYNKENTKPPTSAQVQKTLPLINYKDLEINKAAKTAFLKRKGMRVGLGGIAKGYAVERAAQVIKNLGVTDFAVRAGGDMYVHGTNNGKLWNVAIRNPRDKNATIAVIPVTNGAVSTSGDYERFFMYNGKRYAHIIDPRTGYPADKCQSVTIITKRSVMAEVMSKAAFILGPKEGMRFIEKQEGVEAVIIDAKGEIHVSAGLKKAMSSPSSTDA